MVGPVESTLTMRYFYYTLHADSKNVT